AVARRAKAFGMRVIATRNHPQAEAPYLDQVLPAGQLGNLLAEADYIVVVAAHTPQTRGLLGAAEFRQMKPTAYLINVARGPIISEVALIEALQAGHLTGAGLDVFE